MNTLLEALGWIAGLGIYAAFIIVLAHFLGTNDRSNWRP